MPPREKLSPFLDQLPSALERAAGSNNAYVWNRAVNVNRSYTPNSLNQYASVAGTTFTYDTNGNLTSDGINSYSYTSENRLKAATVGGVSSTLYYDPLGRLSEYDNTTSTRFMSDGAEVAVEVDGSGNVLRRYVRGDNPDEVLVWYEGSGATNRRFLSSDERGSIISATDSSGNLVGINSYDEYGIPASANVGRFQYTGQMYLPELGMYNYKARFYSTTLGRFMQTDPIGYGDGLNDYAYTHNDPVNGSDPTGLSTGDSSGLRGSICRGGLECSINGMDSEEYKARLRKIQDSGGTSTGGVYCVQYCNISRTPNGNEILVTPRPVYEYLPGPPQNLQLAQIIDLPNFAERFGFLHWWERNVRAGANAKVEKTKKVIQECASKVNGAQVAQSTVQGATLGAAEGGARGAVETAPTGGEGAVPEAIKGGIQGAVEGSAESIDEQCSG